MLSRGVFWRAWVGVLFLCVWKVVCVMLCYKWFRKFAYTGRRISLFWYSLGLYRKMGKKKEREVWRLYGSCGVFSLIVPRRSTMLNVGCVGSAVG